MSENYLIHFGVPGMKWGVRKQRENYLTGRKARYMTDKTEYKTLKKSGANQSKVIRAKTKMNASKRLYKIQKKVGKHNKINERYSSAGGRLRGGIDTAVFGSGRMMNKSLNKGDSYGKAAAKTFAKTAAISMAVSTGLSIGGKDLLRKLSKR